MTLGSEDAPVTVTEYASFTCPHCATFHATTFEKLKADYIDTGKVRFVYRDVYFDRPGLWAAMVARCDPDRFFGVSDMIFDQQRDWLSSGDPVGISEALRKIGRVAGLSNDQLDACLTDQAKAEALYDWFRSNAEADEIDSTPTVIVNGAKQGNLPYDDLKAIIEEELAK
ncbi:DsbA family protein [Roseovarius spongiae]|uniref:DsbA family protein n=2 Tax=Roseovarius spongiae TaxID=2320272 RepID=A0A3A8AU85_9RHOB|nr:DsbA family protein [Roseovarius spongiae]